MKTLAVVVLFNPDIGRLKENVNAVVGQVDQVLLVDNGSENLEQVHLAFDAVPKVSFIENGENLGVAAALAIAMDFSKEIGCDWVLTLDQDSVCKPGLVNEYLKYVNMEKVGILTCAITDRNFRSIPGDTELGSEPAEIKQCITSGSFTNVSAYQETDGYDRSLFIDSVDFDICINMREHGFRVVRIPFEGLLHEVGHGKNVSLLGKPYIVYNHGPLRHYYMARNHIILLRKYPNEYSYLLEIIREFRSELLVLLFESQKGAKLMSRWRGIRDASHCIPYTA